MSCLVSDSISLVSHKTCCGLAVQLQTRKPFPVWVCGYLQAYYNQHHCFCWGKETFSYSVLPLLTTDKPDGVSNYKDTHIKNTLVYDCLCQLQIHHIKISATVLRTLDTCGTPDWLIRTLPLVVTTWSRRLQSHRLYLLQQALRLTHINRDKSIFFVAAYLALLPRVYPVVDQVTVPGGWTTPLDWDSYRNKTLPPGSASVAQVNAFVAHSVWRNPATSFFARWKVYQ